MQKDSVYSYEKVRDILAFLANSTKSVTISELRECVSDLAPSNIGILLRRLEAAGYVTHIAKSPKKGSTKFFVATPKTIELYKNKTLVKRDKRNQTTLNVALMGFNGLNVQYKISHKDFKYA